MKKLLIISALILTLTAVYGAFADSSTTDAGVQGCPGIGGSC